MPPPWENSDVSVDAHHVECVDNFMYLGSVQSSDGYSRPDIRRRIALAASVMSSLSNIWRDQRLPFVEFYLYPTVGTVLIHSIKPELTEYDVIEYGGRSN